jgi:acetoin utilization deacetylase AcuC-like enzyme
MVNATDFRKDLGFQFDERFLLHNPGNRHPESPLRLLAIRDALDEMRIEKRWRKIEPRPARLDELELIHPRSHLENLERASKRAPTFLDPDTMVSAESYQIAQLAAGGVLECVDAICSGGVRRAFAFVRPPGHHAEPEKAMGFCLLNNVALAAAYARRRIGLDRVAVVDFDVHHGNGTQAAFYDDPRVLYISSHQFPLYPGSGDFGEIGTGAGKGYTLNYPLPQGAGDGTFIPLYSRIVASVLDQFAPQLIVVSAGFDGHFRDPPAALIMTNAAYASVAASLILAAERNCSGRICFVLEGGYSAEALRDCTKGVMAQMEAERPAEQTTAVNPLFDQISERSRSTVGSYWNW